MTFAVKAPRLLLVMGIGASLAACATVPGKPTADKSSPVVQAKARGEAFPTESGFEIDRPAGEEWALSTDVLSPEGRPIPVVVAHPDSGAQIVVQVSEVTEAPEALARLLRAKLAEEGFMELGQPERVEVDTGADAYGFDFRVEDDASGRVALITVGDQVVLVVASWPKGAEDGLVKDIDEVVRSVRPTAGAVPVMLTPDKA